MDKETEQLLLEKEKLEKELELAKKELQEGRGVMARKGEELIREYYEVTNEINLLNTLKELLFENLKEEDPKRQILVMEIVIRKLTTVVDQQILFDYIYEKLAKVFGLQIEKAEEQIEYIISKIEQTGWEVDYSLGSMGFSYKGKEYSEDFIGDVPF